MIKTKSLNEYIHEILLKGYRYELTSEDLKKVNRIVLTEKDNDDNVIEYDFDDLRQLTELESITLYKIVITDDLIRNLNKLPKLKTLTCNGCAFQAKETLKTSLEMLIITDSFVSNLLNFNDITNLEKIEFVNVGVLDLEQLRKFEEIKKIYIRNSKVLNFKTINEFKMLEYLNLDGSKIDDDSFMDELKSKVEIEMQEYYHLSGNLK